MRQSRRRQQRHQEKQTRRHGQEGQERERFPQWLLWTLVGLVASVGLVLILLAASGVFGGRKSSTPTYVLTTLEMARLASTGQTLGSPTAPVTILEFSDFQCPFCKLFWSGPLAELKKEFVDTGKAKLVYRHMAFLGPESLLAAEASECAGEQGQFFPYHDLLFQNQGSENAGTLTTERLTSFAQQLGLDVGQFTPCLTSHKYLDRVNQSTREASAMGIRGTPTVLINGRLVLDPRDLTEMRSIVRDELKLAP